MFAFGKKVFCNNQGDLATVPVPIYTCQSKVVTREQYNTILARDYIARTRREAREAAAAAVAAAAAAASASANNTTNITLVPMNITTINATNATNTTNATNATNATTTPQATPQAKPQEICSITYGTETLCVCRHDWSGTNCTNPRPITCTLVGPKPTACAPESLLDQLHYDSSLGPARLCNFFDLKKPTEMLTSYEVDLQCKFRDAVSRKCNNTEFENMLTASDAAVAAVIDSGTCVEDRFNYWYDNKKLDNSLFVISIDPVARVRLIFYNLTSLEYVGPNVSTNVLSGKDLVLSKSKLEIKGGLSFVRDLTLIGGRLEGEFQFTSFHRPLSHWGSDKKYHQSVWQVPSVSITYNDANYREPFVAESNGVVMLIVGLVLLLLIAGGGVVLYFMLVRVGKKGDKTTQSKSSTITCKASKVKTN